MKETCAASWILCFSRGFACTISFNAWPYTDWNMNSQTSDIIAMGTRMCLWDMLYRLSTRPERESERELKELHSCVHVQHSGRVQCRASLNTTSGLIQEWMWRSEQKKEDNLILNVMVFNTFRFFKAICKCLHHRDTQSASRVCSWQRFTVLQRSWLLLTGRICLAVTLVEPRPPEGTVKLQD